MATGTALTTFILEWVEHDGGEEGLRFGEIRQRLSMMTKPQIGDRGKRRGRVDYGPSKHLGYLVRIGQLKRRRVIDNKTGRVIESYYSITENGAKRLRYLDEKGLIDRRDLLGKIQRQFRKS